jgi:hypothetical protein
MPYRSIARPTVRYTTGEVVLWHGEEYIVTKGGWKFRSIDIEGPLGVIEFGPYDLVWPEKIFTSLDAQGKAHWEGETLVEHK